MNPKTSQDLFNKIRSQFSNVQIGDENGVPTADPALATFFEFEFKEDADTYGAVSVSLADGENMKVFYNRNLVDKIDEDSKDDWYAFLKELKDFAVEHQLAFDVRDITKSNLTKQDYQNLADTNKTVNTDEMSEEINRITKLAGVDVKESLTGTAKRSYENLDKTRLIIRHTGKVDETVPGARSRRIESLYIENEDGERFKYPLTHLAGARAMTRHVANGGRPHDEFGEHIIKTSEDIAKLNSFSRYVSHKDQLNDNAGDIIEKTKLQLENLREYMRNISKQGHYEAASKDFKTADEVVLDDETIAKLREKFTLKNLDNRVEDALPLINRIMSELEAPKEEAPVQELDDKERTISTIKHSSDEDVAFFDKMMKRYGPKLMELIIDYAHTISNNEQKGKEKLKKWGKEDDIYLSDYYDQLNHVDEDLIGILMTAVDTNSKLIDFFYDKVEQAKKAGEIEKTSRLPDPEDTVNLSKKFKDDQTEEGEKVNKLDKGDDIFKNTMPSKVTGYYEITEFWKEHTQMWGKDPEEVKYEIADWMVDEMKPDNTPEREELTKRAWAIVDDALKNNKDDMTFDDMIDQLKGKKEDQVTELDPGAEPIDEPVEPAVDHAMVVKQFLANPNSRIMLNKNMPDEKKYDVPNATPEDTRIMTTLSDIASRMLTDTPDEDRVANFASRVADQMEKSGMPFDPKDPDANKNRDIAKALVAKYDKASEEVDPADFKAKKDIKGKPHSSTEAFENWVNDIDEYDKEPTDEKDREEKLKTLQNIQLDPNTSKDPETVRALIQRKKELMKKEPAFAGEQVTFEDIKPYVSMYKDDQTGKMTYDVLDKDGASAFKTSDSKVAMAYLSKNFNKLKMDKDERIDQGIAQQKADAETNPDWGKDVGPVDTIGDRFMKKFAKKESIKESRTKIVAAIKAKADENAQNIAGVEAELERITQLVNYQ